MYVAHCQPMRDIDGVCGVSDAYVHPTSVDNSSLMYVPMYLR